MPTFRFPDIDKDFANVRLKDGGGLFASASPHYREAIFGRDSLEVAEDLLASQPEVAREVLLTLAQWQGQKVNPLTEEEPGKIHHEYRALVMDGQPISAHGRRIFDKLSEAWGGNGQELIYYGSVDATPLFIRLTIRYCQHVNSKILDEHISHHSGQKIIFRQSVLAALEWLNNRLIASELGLLEFQRSNPKSLYYQVWKDGNTAYLHPNGLRADFTKPIAAIEVQGYAFDALQGAAEIGFLLTQDELRHKQWATMASLLQQRVLEQFWMPKGHYFALAIDRDAFDRPRQVTPLCSNSALLLESAIFDSLPEEAKRRYISGLAAHIYSPQFMTPVGVRCRSLQFKDLVDFADYHGSWAVWTKETYDIAKGFRRQGFHRLAEQLENRIMNGLWLSGATYEFWYVDPHGRVNYDPFEKKAHRGSRTRLIGTHFAENTQAWTISAALAIRWQRNQLVETIVQAEWQSKLEDMLLDDVPQVSLITNATEAAALYPKQYAWHIDQAEGRKRRLALTAQPTA